MVSGNDIIFYTWFFFRVLFVFLVIVFLISGLDDLFVDLVYYIRAGCRSFFENFTGIHLQKNEI